MLLALLLAFGQLAAACKVHETFPEDGEVVRAGQVSFVWRATGDCAVAQQVNGSPTFPEGVPDWFDSGGELDSVSIRGNVASGTTYTMRFFNGELETRRVDFVGGPDPAFQDDAAPQLVDLAIEAGESKLHYVDASVTYPGAARELLLLRVNGHIRDWAVTTGDPDEVYDLAGTNDRDGWRSCVDVARAPIEGGSWQQTEEECRTVLHCSSGGSAGAPLLVLVGLLGLRRRRSG